MKNKNKYRKGHLIKKPRKNMWGNIVLPGTAYGHFKDLKKEGWFPHNYTWRMCCARYRKKVRKMWIAKESRRRNRRK